MPFVDANRQLADDNFGRYDYTIVGAGAAGTLLALSLARCRRRVLVLESGHFEPDEDRQELNAIEETGKAFGNARWVRKRIIGGTTTAWGGQSLPFSPLDFERRDWVQASGWPIDFEELRPFYDRANAFMGIDQLNYHSDIDQLMSTRLPQFDFDEIQSHYSKWARQPNFQILHRAELGAKATVLYNCHLLRIDLGDGGRVSEISVGNFNGQTRQVPVDHLVLTAGGIETNRILLLNNHQQATGLGNTSGKVGRGFMEHPCIDVGTVTTTDPRKLQASLGSRVRRLRRYGARMSASPSWQTRTRNLAISASLMWVYAHGDVGPLSHLRSFVRRPDITVAPRVIRGAVAVSKGLWALGAEGFVYKPGAEARLTLMAEQEPLDDSAITLGKRLDAFGQRQAALHWRISDATWRTVVGFSQTLKTQLDQSQLGEVHLHDHVRLEEQDWVRHLSDVNHHMGGARMGSSPSDSVVDKNLQVWGVPNLYVCSAAVFPTGSHSNPTLTVLALAARLAEHLVPGA